MIIILDILVGYTRIPFKNLKVSISTSEAISTSFHDTTLITSVAKLKKILGSPSFNANNGRDKVNFEWIRRNKLGDIFTVYDWKEGRKLKMKEEIEFHIGGKNKTITEDSLQELKDALNNL